METPPRTSAALAIAQLVPRPVHAARIAAWMTTALVTFVLLALVAPWQQSVTGEGRVIAYAPAERRQTIDAPVSGRIARWFVQEGARVREGDPLVELSDNDPEMLGRLQEERDAIALRVRTLEERVTAVTERMTALERAQTEAIRAAEARLSIAEQSLEAAAQGELAADAQLETASLQLARERALREQGLTSQRDLELAELGHARARTERDAARARVRGAESDRWSKRADLDRARADADSVLADARSALATARAEEAAARATLAPLEVRVARQEAQRIVAPRAGTILQIVAQQGGEQVGAGEVLAVLVPDTEAGAVELWVDGNDAALLSPGRPVRLQFEGWPAVQFTGWPSVAVGTFAGRVAFVDSTDDGQGDFRVVVTPDPNDEPWPESRFLRQGVRVNGWVLLREVSIGFELWRQLNGFPPALDRPAQTGGSYAPSGYGSSSSSSSYGASGSYRGGR